MTPVERLTAAIEKLEALRAESTPGPWWTGMHDGFSFTIEGPEADSHPVSQRQIRPDADLIVTLHRTIDAQLTILRLAADYHEGDPSLRHGVVRSADNALALADAILGDPS